VRLAGQLRGRRDYEDMPHGSQGLVAVEKNGVCGRAIEVPGLAP
jgi:hypothetical protein